MSTCRSCDAPIIWAITSKGRRMPVDAEPRPDGNVELIDSGGMMPQTVVHAQPPLAAENPLHTPHHMTCPQAHEWRR